MIRPNAFLAVAAAMIFSGAVDAAGLPMRGGGLPAEARRLEVAYQDLKFALSALGARPTGTGVSITVSDRLLPAETAAASRPADLAWAAAVGRAAAALEILTGKEPPRDMIAQNFDGHFAISVPSYGQVVGDDPDQVLGALAAMVTDSGFGQTSIPGVDWQSQIGIMERISIGIAARGGQGFK